METYSKRGTRILLTIILSLALVFGLLPMVPAGEAYAAAGDITVEFRTGSTVTDSEVISLSDLESMATTDVSAEKYLVWDGSKFGVLNSQSGVKLSQLTGLSSLPSGWTLEVTNGTDTKAFGYQDVNNGNFYGESTATTGITTGAIGNTAILSLATGSADVGTGAGDNAGNTVVSTHDDTNLRFLIGLSAKGNRDNRTDDEYIKAENTSARYVENVTKISVVKPGPISNFKIYTQMGDDGAKTLAKTFNGKELDNLAHSDIRAFLQSGSSWAVHGTNKYIPVGELTAAAGAVFNEGDKLVVAAGDGFVTTQTYENLQANRYFYKGTTATGTDTAGPVDVGAVLALNWIGSVGISSGTAQNTVNAMDWSAPNTTGRFYMGVSEANYLAGAAGGNRLITAPVEMTVIKDKADPVVKPPVTTPVIQTIAATGVTLAKTRYTATGRQLKPAVKVMVAGQTLRVGTDYTVTYGTNKLGAGNVTVTGMGTFQGTIAKTFTINPRTTSIRSIKVGKKRATVKWRKAKDAVTGYKIVFKKKGAKKYKVVTVKGQKKLSRLFNKMAANKNYQFKIRTYKKIGKKTYYSTYSKVKTSKRIRR